MSEQERFRWPTVITAATGVVLSVFTVWWVFSAYADYRSRDFTLVSEGPISPASCVGAVTDTQLKEANYDETDWSCSTSSKEELSNLLAASVHGMYQISGSLSGDALNAFNAVVLAIQGDAAGTAYAITREAAYTALAAVGTPASTDCAAIYAGQVEGAAPAPLAPNVVCDADLPSPNTPVVANPQLDKLYTHCLAQFAYARSKPGKGTMTLPKVGEDPKPMLLPVLATNSTTDPVEMARILVGTRWGYSTIFYVVAMMGTAFFLMDCTLLLLAELTRVDAYFGQNAIVDGSSRTMREGMMTMLSTFQAKRDFRWAVAVIILILEALLWVVAIGAPWGFGFDMPRPVCEPGEAQHWLKPFFATTVGGWKLDWDATVLDAMILGSHILVAVALPISEMAERGGSSNEGARDRVGASNVEGYTGVAVGSLRSAWWFAALSVGSLVFYVGQAVAAFRFGIAWAEGVTMGKHAEAVIGAMLYDHVNAILYLSLTIGLTLGSVVGRWLLAGLSCTSFTIFLFWALLTIGGFIPPFFVSSYWIFMSFEDSQGQKDCKAIFGDDDDFLFARTACDVRAATYIVGICLLLVAVVGPIVIGLVDYARVVCLPRRRAWVSAPDYWRNLVQPQNPRYATLGKAGDETVPLTIRPNGNPGATTGFFHFDPKASTVAPSSQLRV